MERIAEVLAQYVVNNSSDNQNNYNLLKYGFQVGLEMLICVSVSVFVAAIMRMLKECIVVLAIFLVLRSYCGGIHLNSFCACFIMSNLVILGILFLTKLYTLPIYGNLVIIAISSAYIFFSEPVENQNRKLDDQEKKYFRKKMRRHITWILAFTAVICSVKPLPYLMLVGLTLAAIALSMRLGKIRILKRCR